MMKEIGTSVRIVAAALLLMGPWRTSGFAADRAQISIQADQRGVRISPLLYGIFFEEINRAGEGGLWGEMLVNPSFEDGYDAAGWSFSGSGRMAIDAAAPGINPNNPTTLRLDLVEAAATVTNKGFKGVGLAIRKGDRYRLSLYARTTASAGVPLTARLVSGSGAVLTEKSVRIAGDRFEPIQIELTPTAEDLKGQLQLVFSGPGKAWIDMVSLFPANTWKGHGLRNDLAEMIAELKPSFVRFPGGCFVEGNQLANAVRWKETIGDPAQRIGTHNLWGYRVNNAFGFHEFLQWCEDLRAEPMYVINCGMAHNDWVSNEAARQYVQDALDAIEYANGPVTSRWGAERARNGHPEPFGMKYLEIGNENWHPAIYLDRYKQFYDAIRAKYPEMVLIANIPVAPYPADMIDDHFYNSPEWFINAATHYDKHDRKGPKIYVGEYAVTRGCGEGNVIAAVAEAAFLTGLERNSDHVLMASYAPLLCNPEWKRWNPNMIVFDQARAYGTPSYHVHQMFSANRGDVVLNSQTRAVGARRFAGAAGLGAWDTQAEFKDILITAPDGSELYRFDPSRNLEGWRAHGGSWSVKDGAIQQTAGGQGHRLLIGDSNWSDYTISLKARKIAGDEGFLILFHSDEHGGKNWFNIGGWGNTEHALEIENTKAPGVRGSIETGRWYDIRIDVRGARVRATLDGRPVSDFNRSTERTLLYCVASHVDSSGDILLKVANPTNEDVTTEISIAGADVSPSGKAMIVSGKPMDENSFAEPGKIAPREAPITNAGRNFTFEFPAYSATVIRLHRR